ncbi:MAG: phage portal protein [Acidobacteriales bacterium]|nr:phage portal protein [Terriglobales bacterium]
MIDRLLRLLGYERRATSQTLAHPRDPLLAEWFGGASQSDAGVTVNESTALNFSAVYRAVHLIAGTVASFPLHTYSYTNRDTGERRYDPSHPLDKLLNDVPNPEMDAATFRETLTGHVLTWGMGYAEKVFNGAGELVELWPIAPDRVTPRRIEGQLAYEIRDGNGGPKYYPPEAIFAVSGFGYDGVVGYSPIRMAQQAIGLGLAAEEFGARFFGKGTHLGGIIKRPAGTPWKDEAAKRFRADFAEWHQGLGKSHKIAVLEDGMDWVRLGIPPEEAQFLETRKFQITEIARWFGVAPHLLYDLDRSTNNNIEQQGLEFLTYCLRYWLRKWERAINRSLMPEADKGSVFVEHVTSDLVRADIVTRYNAYRTGRDGGWLSINDIRRKENEPPIPGGDTYLQPLNMQEAGAQNQPQGQVENDD